MTNIQNLTENPTESEFYPTPTELVQKMLECVDFKKVKTILEPSAGKGDILQVLARKECSTSPYSDRFDVDCIEIDINLRQILKYNFSEEKKEAFVKKLMNSLRKGLGTVKSTSILLRKSAKFKKWSLKNTKRKSCTFLRVIFILLVTIFLAFIPIKGMTS